MKLLKWHAIETKHAYSMRLQRVILLIWNLHVYDVYTLAGNINDYGLAGEINTQHNAI